jgi:hypothetical protein
LLCLAACFLAHAADAQTNGISSSATNTVGLWADGTEYLHIGSTGNVGIDTTSPNTTLQVNGSIMMGTGTCGSSTAGSIQYNGSAIQWCNGTSWNTFAGGGLSGSGTTNYLARWTPNGSTLGIGATYDNGTDVGIGNTSPTNVLSVGPSGNVGQTSAYIQARNAGNSFEWGHGNSAGYASTLGAWAGSGQPFLCFDCEAGTTGNTFKTRGIKGALLESDLAGGFIFATVPTASADNQTAADTMVITTGGNVGIGTTNPGALFTVGSNTFEIDSNGDATLGVNNAVSSTPAQLVFGNYQNSGTTRPELLFNGPSAWIGLGQASTSGNNLRFGVAGSGPSANWGTFGASSFNLLIDGSVGIGTTSPQNLLDVNGNIRDEAVTSCPELVTTSGGEIICTSSDARVKKDIRPLEVTDAMAGIAALKPVTFTFKSTTRPKGTQLGFLAQDVRRIYPGLITVTAKTQWTPHGTLSLNYSGLIAPLVKAVQELKVLFDGDRDEIAKLKADNDNRAKAVQELKSDNDDLRKIIAREENEIADLRREVRAQ